MNKKFKIKPVEMCIYIDQNIYQETHDVELVFEYLQNLFYALSRKKRFFYKEEDYENYSLYGAVQVYLRLTNPKQFLPEGDPKKMKQIKSVLNFIKRILYPLKINYQQENFNRVYAEEMHGKETLDKIKEEMEESCNKSQNTYLKIDTELYLQSIGKIIKAFLRETPYSKNKVVFSNLYLSCLLTLLRGITLSNKNLEAFQHREDRQKLTDAFVERIYADENAHCATQFHLKHNMEDYVGVLTNKIKKIVATDLRGLIQSYQPSEELMKDMMMSPLSDFNENKD